MNNYNEITFKFKAISDNESLARSVVAGLCVPINPTIEIIGDIKTAISEAVTNAIVHGYNNDNTKDVTIDAKIQDNTLIVSVIDQGRGIDNIELALQDYYTSKPNDERSGLGFTIMQSFMDTFSIISGKGNGTIIKMTKNLVG